MSLDLLLDLGLPGLVFLGLCVWLIRKVARAARTEADLEGERLQGTLADELRAGRARAEASRQPGLAAVPAPQTELAAADPLEGADVRGADPAHLAVLAEMVREQERQVPRAVASHVVPRLEVLWVRSNATHAVWCERRQAPAAAAREVICVARIEVGAVVEQWSFG